MKFPIKIILTIALSVFFVEAVLMLVLSNSDIPHGYWVFIDSMALIIFISPVLYFLIYKPLNQQAVMIKKNEEKYRDLFENANDAIFMLDTDHNYIDANQKAVELFGYTKDEFLKLNVMDVIPPGQASTSKQEFQKLKAEGKYEKFMGKQRTKDGRWLDIEVNSSVITKDGKVLGSRDIVRDISERVKAEKEKELIIADLHKALAEVKTLKGLLPLCSFCKQIRDANGEWKEVDEYIYDHSDADISHSVCPNCMKEHYPEELAEIARNKKMNNK